MENLKQRNYKIRETRKTNSLRKTGKLFNISGERVRQICDKNFNQEDLLLEVKHKYKHKFDNHLTINDLLNDINDLSKEDRSKQTVIKRDYLIKFLHDELNLSFLKISTLLKRNHTSIIHSYYKEN